MFDIAHAVANLANYGLITEPWMPQRQAGNQGEKTSIGGGRLRPIVKILESAFDVFRAEFPNADALALKALNGGQSMRVKLQEVIRRAVEHNPKITDEDLITIQVRALVNARGGVITAASLNDEALVREAYRRGFITAEQAADQGVEV